MTYPLPDPDCPNQHVANLAAIEISDSTALALLDESRVTPIQKCDICRAPHGFSDDKAAAQAVANETHRSLYWVESEDVIQYFVTPVLR